MNNLISQLSYLKQWLPFAFVGMSIIAVVLVASIWLILRQMKALKIQHRITSRLLEHIQPSLGLEKNLNFLLELIGSIIDAPVYSFYVYSKNGQYLLKAVRHSEADFSKVRPSYSGLAAYKKEAYMPPISLMPSSIPSKVDIVTEGEVPLLIVPLGGRGVVRIGPIKRVNKRTQKFMVRLGDMLQQVLPEIVLAESMRNQVDVVLASGKALQNISDAAVDPIVTLELMIGACSRAIGAVGGLFLEEDTRTGHFHVKAFSGIEHFSIKELQQDQITMKALCSNFDDNGYRFIQQGEEDYYKLPAYLAAQGSAAVCTVPIGSKGTMVLLFNRTAQTADISMNQLVRISKELNDIIDSQAPLQQLSKVYINILKRLARMMDNLNPFTVGYSEQMGRYSIVIAKQLKLPEDEIRDIALAAYLSNIGVLGLSSELYQKEGNYTEADYEMMKLHSEVGASIVSVTTGNKRVASYIMYHHERMDGGGYPAGLRGNDIPMGARIIAVVQTFLAKINGRKQRDPLPFDQALQMLVSASGSQLDQEVVNALVNWFQSKRSDPKFSGRSLGSCWEMCCSPSSICEHCPVYQSSSSNKNCWDFEDNLCNLHGKSCATCFVKTEVLTRKGTIRIP